MIETFPVLIDIVVFNEFLQRMRACEGTVAWCIYCRGSSTAGGVLTGCWCWTMRRHGVGRCWCRGSSTSSSLSCSTSPLTALLEGCWHSVPPSPSSPSWPPADIVSATIAGLSLLFTFNILYHAIFDVEDRHDETETVSVVNARWQSTNSCVASCYLLPNVLASQVRQWVASVRPSVRPSVSTLSFEPTDLWTLVFLCGSWPW